MREALMKRSSQEKKVLNQRIIRNSQKAKKTTVADFIKGKKKIVNNLNSSFVTDNKLFWKTIKPFFPNISNHITNNKRS